LSWLVHFARRAASRAACTAGSNSPTSTPMMAITTSSSTSVNATRCLLEFIAVSSTFDIATSSMTPRSAVVTPPARDCIETTLLWRSRGTRRGSFDGVFPASS